MKDSTDPKICPVCESHCIVQPLILLPHKDKPAYMYESIMCSKCEWSVSTPLVEIAVE